MNPAAVPAYAALCAKEKAVRRSLALQTLRRVRRWKHGNSMTACVRFRQARRWAWEADAYEDGNRRGDPLFTARVDFLGPLSSPGAWPAALVTLSGRRLAGQYLVRAADLDRLDSLLFAAWRASRWPRLLLDPRPPLPPWDPAAGPVPVACRRREPVCGHHLDAWERAPV